MTARSMQTYEVGPGTIRVGDTLLGRPDRVVRDMRWLQGGGKRLRLSDGTIRTLTPSDVLIVLRPSDGAQ